MNSSKLELRKSKVEDSGLYTVVLRNALGQTRSTANVVVEE